MSGDTIESLRKAIVECNLKSAVSSTKRALEEGLKVNDIIQKGLVSGISTVGELFSKGDYYLPELLLAGKVMSSALEILAPILASSSDTSFHTGKYLIATIQGDVHDIGKNIVSTMLKGNGWEITDLGVDVPPEKINSEIAKGGYDILGLSALLTMTMPAAAATIKAIEQAGLRGTIKIMIGGAPITQEFADKIGADAYAEDAWAAVVKAGEIMRAQSAERRS
jgi:5-methyltetrahydrofolate--homocysteine methyltransferase